MARPRKHRKALTVEIIKQAAELARLRATGNSKGKRALEWDGNHYEMGLKDVFLWDGREHGLGVKITPTGSAVFILQKTVRGTLRRITIGNFGDKTLDAAQRRARVLNGLIADGRDPIAEEEAAEEAEKRRGQLEKTISDLWEEYEREVVAKNKPRTREEKRRMWSARIEDPIGKLKVKDVTRSDVSAIVSAPLQEDTNGDVIGGLGEAGNLYRLLRHMFYKALLWGLRPRELGNPLKEVTEPRVKPRQLKIGDRAIGALLKATDECATQGIEPKQVTAVVKVAVLTGARISELLGLRWDNVSEDASELRWEDTKTGQSVRPVSGDVMKLIKSMRSVAPGSPYVFPALSDPTLPLPYSTVRHAFERICARAGVKNCTLHTLRHYFATETANSVNNHKVGMQLTGHRSLTAYMGYVHAEKEQAHALVKEQLAPLYRKLNAAPSNVVAAKRKAHA